jgi:hypothetical protein
MLLLYHLSYSTVWFWIANIGTFCRFAKKTFADFKKKREMPGHAGHDIRSGVA